jgi:hypothetical protein
LFSVQCSVLSALQCSLQCFLGDTKLQSQRGIDRWTVLWPKLGSECRALGGSDLFSVQCSVLSALQCSFQCFLGETKLQSQSGTDRWTVLWSKLGSECRALGGSDLFSVQCSVLSALQCSFQCFLGETKLQSQSGTDRWTVLWPELGSECRALGDPDLFSVQCSNLSALQCSFQCFLGDT